MPAENKICFLCKENEIFCSPGAKIEKLINHKLSTTLSRFNAEKCSLFLLNYDCQPQIMMSGFSQQLSILSVIILNKLVFTVKIYFLNIRNIAYLFNKIYSSQVVHNI